MTYMTKSQHKNPCPEGYEICKFSKPLPGLYGPCPRVDNRFFLKYINLNFFIPKLPFLG